MDAVAVDLWLEQVLADFKKPFAEAGKTLHVYPDETVGEVLVHREPLELLVRSLLANLLLFAYETEVIDISLRRGRAMFQIMMEHSGPPVPAALKSQILRTIPADFPATHPQGVPATEEQLAAWAGALGGHYTETVTQGSGISYVIQVPFWMPEPLRPAKNTGQGAGSEKAPLIPDSWFARKRDRAIRILLVEDSLVFRNLLLADLQHEPYLLDVAENGREGFEKVKAGMFDLIVSDVMMPEMNGVDFADAVRSLPSYRDVPFVFLTSMDSAADVVRGLSAGADAYLTKPVRIDILKAHIYALLLRSEHLRRTKDSGAEGGSLTARVDDLLVNQMGNPDFSVDSIITILGLSRSAFYRAWSATGNEPVNTRLLRMRLHFAAGLLRTGNLSVAQAAAASGFSDPAYFTKAFKKAYGILPSRVA